MTRCTSWIQRSRRLLREAAVDEAICADGTKVPVGLWLGDTENKTVVTNLLADLSARGLDAAGGIFFVIDGAKALAAGVRKVFGDHALIQRCTLHKRRNVTDHLARDQRAWLDRKLAGAFNNPDPVAGLRAAKELAKLLEDKHPDAAASLREGLDDMFTVRRLGLSGPALPHAEQHQHHRVDDLRRQDHDPQRQAVARRQDDQAVGRRRDAQRRAQLPPHQGRQGHAHPPRRSRHYPPGTSKWNRIEHRIFSFITMNWRGRPLTSLRTIIELISATRTSTGLTIQADHDPNWYPKGVKISDAELAAVPLQPHDWHGDWNYTVLAQPNPA